MNKFTNKLLGSAANIKADRAKLTNNLAKAAQERLIRSLTDDINSLELREMNISDFGPDTTEDLKVGKNFNAERWANEMQQIKVELALKQAELEIAKQTDKDWFGETEA